MHVKTYQTKILYHTYEIYCRYSINLSIVIKYNAESVCEKIAAVKHKFACPNLSIFAWIYVHEIVKI